MFTYRFFPTGAWPTSPLSDFSSRPISLPKNTIYSTLFKDYSQIKGNPFCPSGWRMLRSMLSALSSSSLSMFRTHTTNSWSNKALKQILLTSLSASHSQFIPAISTINSLFLHTTASDGHCRRICDLIRFHFWWYSKGLISFRFRIGVWRERVGCTFCTWRLNIRNGLDFWLPWWEEEYWMAWHQLYEVP